MLGRGQKRERRPKRPIGPGESFLRDSIALARVKFFAVKAVIGGVVLALDVLAGWRFGLFGALTLLFAALSLALFLGGRQLRIDHDKLLAIPKPQLLITAGDGPEFERTHTDAPLPSRVPSHNRSQRGFSWRSTTKLCRIDNIGDGEARNPRVTVTEVSPRPSSMSSAAPVLDWDGVGRVIPPHDHAFVVLTQRFMAKGSGFVAEPSDSWSLMLDPNGVEVVRSGAVEVSLSAWCDDHPVERAHAKLRIVGIGTEDFPSVTQVAVSPAVPRPG